MHRIPAATWAEIRTAYASGIGLREIARNMGIPAGTVLARASRERWTRGIETAKSMAKPVEAAIVPACDAAARSMQERATRYTSRMAGVSERVLPHLESLPPGEILDHARNVEQFDRVARRTFGLDSGVPGGGTFNLAVLCDQTAIQVISTNPSVS